MTEQLQKTDLKNMTRDELKAFMKEMGLLDGNYQGKGAEFA